MFERKFGLAPLPTLIQTWQQGFINGTSRACQGLLFDNSEQVVDQEMNNICSVVGNPVHVTPVNSQASWD
ncbi:MAG: hypothetical protein LBS28_01205 [Streptococcaceae bacterium]|jgi:hypothetical protein|nr:hypothetical protein [Streptococcaceae bacterium]